MGYLTEDNGTNSATRLIFIIGSLWTMAICTYLAFQGVEPVTLIAVFTPLEGVWIGLKLGQKPMEQKK